MKKYIKPETTLLKVEEEQILAAVSLDPNGATESKDPWIDGAAKPHKPGGILDFSWNDLEEEEENE